MVSEDIVEKKNEVVEKVAETDKKFIEMAVDAVMEYFEKIEEKPEKCASNGRICPSMIAKDCTGMPFVDEARIRQVLDVMYTKGLLEREIPEGTGIPHYFRK
ncbi:MAG: hypothetical protein ACOCTL_05035 [Candidatus Hadarchaeota archaeon]